jgi:hypothetical protein
VRIASFEQVCSKEAPVFRVHEKDRVMDYKKIDASLHRHITQTQDDPNPTNDRIALFIKINGRFYTARLSVTTIDELSEQVWVEALFGSNRLRPSEPD